MAVVSPGLGSDALTQTLCVAIVAIVAAAVVYAAWIGIINFSRIGV